MVAVVGAVAWFFLGGRTISEDQVRAFYQRQERAALERSAWLTNRAAEFVARVCLDTLRPREYAVVRAVVDAATAEACPALSRLLAAATAFSAANPAPADAEAELRAAATALSAAYRAVPSGARPPVSRALRIRPASS